MCAGASHPLDEQALKRAIALGDERTFQQDPKYALRLLVDIAIKALSPAINDPTTAVLALDQIEDLLSRMGNFVLYQEGKFGPQILEHAKKKGVARLALMTLAHHAWPRGADRSAWPKCWYKPIDDPALGEKSVRFTLSEDVTAAIPPGEEKLFRMALEFGGRFRPLSAKEREDLLDGARGLPPIFRA